MIVAMLFTGSLAAGLTSDSECEDKKSSASSTGGGGGSTATDQRTYSAASPQPNSSLVPSHDYNVEQSNVALLKAELRVSNEFSVNLESVCQKFKLSENPIKNDSFDFKKICWFYYFIK